MSIDNYIHYMSHCIYMRDDNYLAPERRPSHGAATKGLLMNDHISDAPEGAESPDRPLGFWLRTVDGLLGREFAAAFEAEGLGRRDWMLLNAVSGAADDPRLDAVLARRGKRLRGLVERGWVVDTDGRWQLTDDGRAAVERLSRAVDGIRRTVADAVSPEDYATTTASLEAMARSLGWDETARPPRFGRRRGHGRPAFGVHGFGGFGPGLGGHERHGGFAHGGHGFGPTHHGHGRPGFVASAGGCGDAPARDGRRGRDERPGHPGERAYGRGFEAGFAAARRDAAH